MKKINHEEVILKISDLIENDVELDISSNKFSKIETNEKKSYELLRTMSFLETMIIIQGPTKLTEKNPTSKYAIKENSNDKYKEYEGLTMETRNKIVDYFESNLIFYLDKLARYGWRPGISSYKNGNHPDYNIDKWEIKPKEFQTVYCKYMRVKTVIQWCLGIDTTIPKEIKTKDEATKLELESESELELELELKLKEAIRKEVKNETYLGIYLGN